ncbi:MAG: Uncharacterised protein [Hyphomonas sp. TMED17]|nr:MAG: Uncharacterised protein [Hyphomonas sp. TMED17]
MIEGMGEHRLEIAQLGATIIRPAIKLIGIKGLQLHQTGHRIGELDLATGTGTLTFQ